MDIRFRTHEPGPVVAAVFALIVLGVGSLYLTWQSIEHQRDVVQDHMVLSGGVIVRGVEGNIVRIARSLRGHGELLARFPELVNEYFQELTETEEVAFVALYDPEGKLILGTQHEGEVLDDKLPEEAHMGLVHHGNWHGMTTFQDASVLAVALPARPGLSRLIAGAAGSGEDDGAQHGMRQGMGHNMGQGMGRGQGHGQGRGNMNMDQEPEAPVFFVVGMNAERHMAQFRLFRRAALLQTGYVFGAGVVLWIFTFAYLRRRGEIMRMDRMERFQSTLLDNMPDGLVTLASNGEIVAANPTAMKLLDPACAIDGAEVGCPVVGRNWSEFPFGDCFGPGNWQQHEYHGRKLEMLCVPLAGADEPEEGRDAPPDSSQDQIGTRLMLVRDRTELHSLEEDLTEAKRLATIGSLAAGVAHEVRNPLSSLRGFAQLFASKFKNQAPYDEYAATMVKEADRLNRVVTDLLYLARPRPVEVDSVPLAPAMDSLMGLMRFDLEHKRVTPELKLDAPTVCADADGLTQVLMNLVTNALDALPEIDGPEAGDSNAGGTLRISSRMEGEHVVVRVEDSGPGIPPEEWEQALEPFFTTKKKGTGLGLAIVNTILRGHRGRVQISESDLGGAAVDLYFPELGKAQCKA